MMKSNMKNLELSEKISIIMQRVVFNNPELMNEQMKQVINQFKDKDLRGYTLLDWNVKSLINL